MCQMEQTRRMWLELTALRYKMRCSQGYSYCTFPMPRNIFTVHSALFLPSIVNKNEIPKLHPNLSIPRPALVSLLRRNSRWVRIPGQRSHPLLGADLGIVVHQPRLLLLLSLLFAVVRILSRPSTCLDCAD